MVAESACLIVADHKYRGLVCCSLGHSVDNFLLEPGPISRCVGWVLRELSGADDVGDCGEGAVCCLGIEGVEAETCKPFLKEWGAGCGVLVLSEPGKRIVVKVVGILIDAPRDASILIEFRGGLPLLRVAVEAARLATYIVLDK
jgi:hypothetical protein